MLKERKRISKHHRKVDPQEIMRRLARKTNQRKSKEEKETAKWEKWLQDNRLAGIYDPKMMALYGGPCPIKPDKPDEKKKSLPLYIGEMLTLSDYDPSDQSTDDEWSEYEL